ncbi:aldo/keto reductase [Citrobacter koseri]|uniref:aldo/keto reductase n=1 Tax=Citrobacter koseri TaxID=545 RepID=UPI0023B028B7|nr:aldo/keto reductase [Citrobacter koseri]
MVNQSPFFMLNNEVQMPALGLGVFQSSPEETIIAVSTAIAGGYRLIDTAARYANEPEVGEGIRQSGVDRNQIFVTTKLWFSDYGYDAALRAFDRSLSKLGLDYLDLYLLHWPVPSNFDKTLTAWRAMETLLAERRVRAIGVSNFNSQRLMDLIAHSSVTPAVNQVELHPFFAQRQLQDVNAKLGIVTQAWSPIGGIRRYWKKGEQKSLEPLSHPVITFLAQKYKKSAAQIVLRWHMHIGTSAIPKSVNPVRIVENFNIFDFTLTTDEVAAITALDTGERGGPDPELVSAKFFDA